MLKGIKLPISDIRFWILLFFIVRLYGIWFAPIELTHNWRQTTVTMVARNFLEVDANPLYPRLDIAGEKSGITGMEFPLLNYLCYLVSAILGYQHWYGRLIVLIASSFGIFYFFKICKKHFSDSVAFNASIVLLFSIWFTYSRKIMPDTFSMSMIIFGLYHGIQYLEKKQLKHLIYYSIWIGLGTLSKLPSAYILPVLALPFFIYPQTLRSRILFIIGSSIPMVMCIYWYYVWVPYLTKNYGFAHFFMGKSISKGAQELIEHWPETISKFYDVAIKYIAFTLMIWGLITGIRQKNKLLLVVFAIGFLCFLPIMLKGGFTFYHHSYYIIPLVPVMALASGYGISQIKSSRWQKILLLAIGLEGTLNHLDDFRIKEEYRSVLQLEQTMDAFSSRNDLIVVNSGAFPTPVYFSHRKGWVAFNGELSTPSFTDSLVDKGLKYIIIMKRVFGEDLILPYKEVFNNSEYRIYATEGLHFENAQRSGDEQ